jgi:ABC-type polysaccharide/polyol phosphate transport system ATPase subunit
MDADIYLVDDGGLNVPDSIFNKKFVQKLNEVLEARVQERTRQFEEAASKPRSGR